MRKVTTPAKVCKECGHILIHEKYDDFCDHCKEKVTREYPLRITVFFEGRSVDTTDPKFCSWKCLLSWLKEFPLNKKMVSFVNIDHLGGSAFSFEEEYDKFFEAIRCLESTAKRNENE